MDLYLRYVIIIFRQGIEMKTMLLVCQNCGHEERIKIYTREEAERRQFQLTNPRCKKCGSANARLYD